MITANHSYLLAFDNLSTCPPPSPTHFAGSRAVAASRYGDSIPTMTRYCFKRPARLSERHRGCRPPASAIFVTLAAITEKQRRPEQDLWRDFETARPRILGPARRRGPWLARAAPVFASRNCRGWPISRSGQWRAKQHSGPPAHSRAPMTQTAGSRSRTSDADPVAATSSVPSAASGTKTSNLVRAAPVHSLCETVSTVRAVCESGAQVHLPTRIYSPSGQTTPTGLALLTSRHQLFYALMHEDDPDA
jgi:hypothetical protein